MNSTKHPEDIETTKADLLSAAAAIGSIAELGDEHLQAVAEAISSAGKTLDRVSVETLALAIHRLWDVGMDLTRIDLGGLFFDSPVSLPPHPDDEPNNVVSLRPDGEVDA
jgi:hypothetical protein